MNTRIIGVALVAVASSAFGQTQWELRQQGATTPACSFVCAGLTPPPPGCPAPPAPTVTTQPCPTGTTGSWQQTATQTRGPAPECVLTTIAAPTAAPAGACTAVVTPPPPTAGCTGTTWHLAAAGNNANAGTQAAPKASVTSAQLNALPAGSCVLYKRGDTFTLTGLTLENPSARVDAPLTLGAWGTGARPTLRQASGNAFNIGGGWNNTSNDGGYVIRGLKLDGLGTATWGVWFVNNVRDVVIEDSEITGFAIGINSNDGAPYGVRGITLRNNSITRNRSMGMLGHYSDMLVEGNLFEANNFGGSTFDHGIYLGGGHNIRILNNRFIRNSVLNGVCTGGNVTFHGVHDGLLIEGNRVEQDAAASQCWLMSVTQGYSTAESFRNTVIRGNKLIGGGNTVMAVQSAPGVVVENNVVLQINATAQTAFNIGSGPGPYADGDAGDANAIVRGNRVCRTNAGASGSVVNVNSPGSQVSDNTLITGAAASTGICAR